MQGFVVGFSGAEAYCLRHAQAPMMQSERVPLSAHMRDLLNQGNIDKAYQVDWLRLRSQ